MEKDAMTSVKRFEKNQDKWWNIHVDGSFLPNFPADCVDWNSDDHRIDQHKYLRQVEERCDLIKNKGKKI